jgi:hypothetical protein
MIWLPRQPGDVEIALAVTAAKGGTKVAAVVSE